MTTKSVRYWLPLAACVLALLLAEGGVRVLAVATGRDRMMAVDDRLGWVLRPGVEKLQRQEQAYRVRINSRGLRDDEAAYERSDGVKRILLLGDSFAFGFGGVEFGERFSEVLEQRRPDLEVVNTGVPSYEPVQQYLYLIEEGVRYRPDLVLLTLYVNDYRQCFQPYDHHIGRPKGYVSLEGGELRFHEPRLSWSYRLSQSSYLFGAFDSSFGLRYYWADHSPPAVSEEERPLAWRKLISKIRAESQAAGAQFAAAFFPAPVVVARTIPDLMTELAQEEGFLFEDLSPELRPGPERSDYYFKVDPHLSAAGNALVGELLDQRIVGPLLYGEARGETGGEVIPLEAAPKSSRR